MQRRLGIMDEAPCEKITAWHLGEKTLPTEAPMTGAEVRVAREAAFGRYLNGTPGYVSQLERGEAQAKGPALALLNVIRRRSIEGLY